MGVKKITNRNIWATELHENKRFKSKEEFTESLTCQIGHLYADTLFVSALPGEPAVLYTQINGCRAYVAEWNAEARTMKTMATY